MIYLDHAATSHPKPQVASDAVLRWFRSVGVSPDRGEGPQTREARQVVARCREAIARRTGHEAARVAFCSGATEGLNLALRALLRPGARVLTTPFEHAAVVRPLTAMRDALGLSITRLATPDELLAALGAEAWDLLVFTHASNVTGLVLPAAQLCAAARAAGVTVLLDASQTAGYLPLDCGAQVVVASAHKALHGPPGLGFVSAHAAADLPPQKYGGTGSSLALEDHPNQWPAAFEAGTPNTPALFGLDAALTWLDERGEHEQLQAALARLDQLRAGLQEVPGLRLLHAAGEARTPVLSLTHRAYDPAELGAVLASAGVHARAGFHCAPWVHEHLGTSTSGTLRLSPGPETTEGEVAAVVDVLRAL
jgi:selenocysteine lyase/cysteine desulfurase